jgi:hypothetical protein
MATDRAVVITAWKTYSFTGPASAGLERITDRLASTLSPSISLRGTRPTGMVEQGIPLSGAQTPVRAVMLWMAGSPKIRVRLTGMPPRFRS